MANKQVAAPQSVRQKPPRPKPAKMTPAEQRHRFIETAREAGASEDEAEFDANLTKVVRPKSCS